MKARPLLIALLALFLPYATIASAQSAKSILDTTASKLKKSGGIEASFVATAFKGTTPSGTTDGSICVQGNRFKITSSHSTTWFDGKTQWALVAGSNEAYVSTPTEAELQSINPYSFVNLYKSGYNLSLHQATYAKRPCHEVWLIAQSRGQSIHEMRLTIDPSTYLPLCVRVKQKNGNWVRINIGTIHSGRDWPASFFRFNEKEHPAVDVIDLR